MPLNRFILLLSTVIAMAAITVIGATLLTPALWVASAGSLGMASGLSLLAVVALALKLLTGARP